jgi:ABC-type transporter Mla subunit MlaD
MNFDVNSVVKKLKKLESSLKTKIESGSLYNEMKRFANGQAKTLSQKVKSSKDAKKVLAAIQERKKQIEKIASDLPGEVKTVRTYVKSQRKELEKLGNVLLKKARAGEINAASLRSAIRAATTKKAASSTKKKAVSKKKTTKKTAVKAAKK